MKTKNIITIAAVLLLGIGIGKFAFNTNSEKVTVNHKNETAAEHWTCSMHPQIDMPEPGQCPICGMDLIPKSKDEEGLAPNSFKMTKNALALAGVETLTIGDLSSETPQNRGLSLSGKIVANEKQTAVQTAHFGGRIEKLYIKSIGEKVNRGALIGKFYSPELVTAQNELIEAIDIKDAQPELYNAVRNKLKYWKISEKQIQQIERDKKVIENFNMYADVSGYVSEIIAQEGNHLKEGLPIFKVSNLNTVWASFDIYEKDISKVHKGDELLISFNAFPDKQLKAKIDYIDPILNTKTRTVTARVTLNNRSQKYKPGMIINALASVKVGGKSQNTILVPKTAVLWTGKRAIVYIKPNPDKAVFELREITLGNTEGDNYQVLNGISNGDEIVVNGTFTVDATAQLLGKKSMMNKGNDKNEIPEMNMKKPKEVKPKKEATMKCAPGKCGSSM